MFVSPGFTNRSLKLKYSEGEILTISGQLIYMFRSTSCPTHNIEALFLWT